MKYCVMYNLRFETPAKRDNLEADIALKVLGKKVWGNTVISKGEDEEGYPSSNLEIRFENKIDMDELFALIKDRMAKIPVLKGSVSKHNCPHNEGGIPCVILEEFKKV